MLASMILWLAMAIAYPLAALKSKRIQDVIDATDSKTFAASTGGGATGKLVIGTSSLSGGTGVLITFDLQNPSFTESGGVATLAGTPLSANASAGGTAAKAELRKDDDTTVATLTVGTAAADIIISSTTIVNGAPYQVTSGTITHP